MDLKETQPENLNPRDQRPSDQRPRNRRPGIPNLGRRIGASAFWMAVFGGTGFLLFEYTKNMGTERNRERIKLERLQGRADNTPGKEQMIIDTLMGQGPASLSELKKRTEEKRYQIAEENAVYAIPTDDKNKDIDKSQIGDKVKSMANNAE